MSQGGATRIGGRALGAGLALSLVAACHTLEAKIHNLGELHHEDAEKSYQAALMGDLEYLFRKAFSVSAPLGIEFEFDDKEPEFVEDPSEACLELLVGLSGFPLERERVLALRTEMYVWLAMGDPFVLSRERCVLELGEVGRRLGVTEPLEEPPLEARLSVEETTELVTELVATAAPVLGEGPRTLDLTLEEACARILAREPDVRSGRRLLRTTAALLDASRADRAAADPLRAFARDLSARLTAIALGSARYDPDGRVRAAALRAWTRATDHRTGAWITEALGDPDERVLAELFRILAERGLPEPPAELDPREREAWHENWIANLVRSSGEHLDGTVSAAACRALGRISGAGFESLRFEDWYAWWEARAAARLDESLGGGAASR